MPKAIRYLESGAVYEICFRAKSSLPFVAYECLNYAIQCVLARVQRDNKVILCHDIWNGSHPHVIVVSKDSEQLVKFQMEIKKKVTDIWKCLLGLEHLEIWEGNTTIIKIGDLEAAKERIAYLYANPAQDNLEDRIELFPGASSWSEYQKCLDTLNGETSERYPWIRLRSVPRLSGNRISVREDREVIESFQRDNKYWYQLKRNPNAWMRCFGVKTDVEVQSINRGILRKLRQNELTAREERVKKGQTVFGASALKSQQILKPHKPKKRDGKIFIITTDRELRLAYIKKVKALEAKCRECYFKWRQGFLSVKWPPEIFRPTIPPMVNLFAT